MKDHVTEMPNGTKCGQQLPIKWGPELLVGEELGGEERQGLPSIWAALIDNGANSVVRGIRGYGEGRVWAGVAKLDC